MIVGCLLASWLGEPQAAHAQDVRATVTVEAGAPWIHSRSDYVPIEPPGGSQSKDTVSRWGPGAAALLLLTGRVRRTLHVGGAIRAGVATANKYAVDSIVQRQGSFALGPTVRLHDDTRTRGVYGGLWVGFVAIPLHGFGWGAGIDVGYQWTLGRHWSLGIGAGLTTQWSYHEEQGDLGRYHYLQRSVWPMLQVRVAHGFLQ